MKDNVNKQLKFASKGYPKKFVSDENLKFYNTDNKTLLR